MLVVLTLVACAGAAEAQARTSTAKIRFLHPRGTELPASLFIVRDAGGTEIAPQTDPFGTFSFVNVGRKITVEFANKATLKGSGMELVLEEGPTVFVTLKADPFTGKVKSVVQKAVKPEPASRHARRPGGRPGRQSFVIPANDACANALAILDGVTAFSTVGATTDGAPDPNGQYDGQTYKDIWYVYTPTCNGTLTASTCGTASYDTDLALYEADADGDGDHDALDCANITSGAEPALASNDDAGTCAGSTSAVATTVVADRPYMIRVGGFGPNDEGAGTLQVSCSGAPSNDICSAPRTVVCGSSLQVTNVAATGAASDPEFGCAFFGPAQGDGTLWFDFTATSSSAFLSTSNSVGVSDSLLAVYDGSCGSLVELACDDDSGIGTLAELCVNGLTVGQKYLVQVATLPGEALGRITLDLECPGPCLVSCDDCSLACEIPCGGSLSVDNTRALTDPLDPAFGCRTGGAEQGAGTLWFKFVATASSARIHTNDSLAIDTLLAVYSGTCGALTEIGCSDDEGAGLHSVVCVSGLSFGQTYYIQAASFDSFSTGQVTVTVECPCAVALANDDCAGALGLGPLPASVTVDLTEASDDIGSPCGLFAGPFFNVWYTVTGTGNVLTASTCNGGTLVDDTKISVFCAECAALVCVAGNDDDPRCSFDAGLRSSASWCSQAGAKYLVTVGTFSPFTTPRLVQLDVFESGGPCVAEVQCQPTGACCLADGSCVQGTQEDCAAEGGTYSGDGLSCLANAIADGSFEAASQGSAWSMFSSNFGSPLCDGTCGGGGGAGAHSGNFWCWFGGVAAFEEASAGQSVTIPIGASTLDFFLGIPVATGNGADFLEVKIDGLQVHLEAESAGPFVGYRRVSIPLAGFADGGVHALEFHSIITGVGGITNFFVDDVVISTPAIHCVRCVTLDFDTEDDLVTPIGNGQTLTTPPEFGLLVDISSAGANLGITAFDSTPGGPNGATADADMLIGKGNILMLQSNAKPTQGVTGFFDTPVDDANGGDLLFRFTSPSEAQSVVLIDLDPEPNQGATVTLTDTGNRTRMYTVQPGWTGTYGGVPGWKLLDLTTTAPQVGNAPGFRIARATEMPGFVQAQVVLIKVHLTGSGAMDDLSFCR